MISRVWNNLPVILGVAGVSPSESARVRFWAGILEIPVSLATLWLPFAYYAESRGLIDPTTRFHLDLIVWGLFLVEALVLSIIVRQHTLYWSQNWLNLLIVLTGLPLLFVYGTAATSALRILRLLLMAVVLIRVARQSIQMLARRALGATLMVAVFLVGSVGTLVATIDPAFHSLWDGLWWAVVTITTVGYGDYVPTSAEGRVLGVFLIVFGVVTFSMVMANVSAFIVGLQVKESTAGLSLESNQHERQLLERLDQLDARLDRLERLLVEQRGQSIKDADVQKDAPSRP